MIYLACIVATLIGGIALHRRGAAPWRLYALGTEIYLLLGVSSVVVSRFAPQLIWGFPFSRGGVPPGGAVTTRPPSRCSSHQWSRFFWPWWPRR
ncbi:hypothetical protein ACSQ76_14235 [Roseovarius sp. B08]|uniref:hypothetical protein n=1 Tax=Roseovarius sp. B08 TaxID=3449223 RepID=UPI003EDB8A14